MPDTHKIRENLTKEERERLQKYGSVDFKSAEAPGSASGVPATG
jgi:hypothetical protein